MQWHWEHFSALDAGTAYRILAARAAVFVVEQHCAYLDPDGLDGDAWHLWASAPDGAIAACLRVLRERDFIPTHGSLRRAGLGSGTSVIPRHQRVERRVGLGGQVRDLA